jgi:hypothetical protein
VMRGAKKEGVNQELRTGSTEPLAACQG